MDKILTKFNLNGDPEKFSIFVSMTDSARVLGDAELLEVCCDPMRPEREKLFLRKKHTGFAIPKARDVIPDQPISRNNVVPSDASSTSGKSTGGKSALKLNKFFGERPPSELISSNLLDFFPKDGVLKLERRKSRRVRREQSLISEDFSSSLEENASNTNTSDFPNDFQSEFSYLPHEFSSDGSSTLLSKKDYNALSPRPFLSERKSSLSRDLSIGFSEASFQDRMERESEQPANDVEDAVEQPSASLSPHASASEPATPISPVAPEPAPSRWIKGALIGQGSFGSVYLGLNYFTGELMAVKQVEIPKEDVNTQSERKNMLIEALDHEISFLKDLNHPHIVRYLGSITDDNFFNIFLEYIPGGSIHSNLKTWGSFPEPVIKSYLRQILEGLEYLHEKDIIHRDIKAANILVDNHAHVKISDFGISKRVESEDQSLIPVAQGGKATTCQAGTSSIRVSLEGSVFWMAPEIVKHMKYSRKSDIWSVGCCVIEMFTANHPWKSASQVEVLFKVSLFRMFLYSFFFFE
jgi:mitogen-activated protein kinase kinase kinase